MERRENVKTPEEKTIDRLMDQVTPIVKRIMRLSRNAKQVEVDNDLKQKCKAFVLPFKKREFEITDINFTPLWKRSALLRDELKRLEEEGMIPRRDDYPSTCALISDRKCVVQLSKTILNDDGEIKITVEITIRHKNKHDVIVDVFHGSNFSQFLQPKVADIIVLLNQATILKFELERANRPRAMSVQIAEESTIDTEGGSFAISGSGQLEEIKDENVEELVKIIDTLSSKNFFEGGSVIEFTKTIMTEDGFTEEKKKELTAEQYWKMVTDII